MKLNFFAGCTEAIPIGATSYEEIHVTMPVRKFFGLFVTWVCLTPPINQWRVRHVIEECCGGACGAKYDVIYVEYYKNEEWHRLWREHVHDQEWYNIWPCIRSAIKVCRESMPEVIAWEESLK